jgi:hypothetical protein
MSSYFDTLPDEQREWYQLTPQERWEISQELWQTFLTLGGSLDPEPDTQSPFFDPSNKTSRPIDGGTGLRVIRRC